MITSSFPTTLEITESKLLGWDDRETRLPSLANNQRALRQLLFLERLTGALVQLRKAALSVASGTARHEERKALQHSLRALGKVSGLAKSKKLVKLRMANVGDISRCLRVGLKPRVNYLEMGNSQLTATSAIAPAMFGKSLLNMQILVINLCSCKLELDEVVPYLTDLRVLRARNSPLDGRGCEAIVNGLPNLVELRLDRASIRDEWIRPVLFSKRSLKFLHLSNNPDITEETGRNLIRGGLRLTSLEIAVNTEGRALPIDLSRALPQFGFRISRGSNGHIIQK